MDNPLVSVVIPTYNRATTIEKAVNSVLNQTYSNIEVIVVDDGSKDNTEEKILGITDKRLRYIKQENNGACAARNNGILHAHGDYIAFNDSDDTWRKNKLDRQLTILKEKDADGIFCKLLLKTKNGRSLTLPNIAEGFLDLKKSSIDGIGTQSLLFKRKVLEDFKFNEQLPRLQDFELLFRILDSNRYSIYCMDEGLINYTLSNDSISNNFEKFKLAVNIITNSRDDFRKNYPLLSKYFSRMFLTHAKYDLNKMNLFNFVDDLFNFIKYYPILNK